VAERQVTGAWPPDFEQWRKVAFGRWAGSGISRVNRSSHEADLRL